MRFPQSTPEIFESVVALMRPTVEINSIDTVDDIHTLNVCNIFWLQQGMEIVINSNTYRVQSIAYPNTLVLQGSVAIAVDSFQLAAPFFFHGTPIATGEDLSQIQEAKNKTPMIWLMEGYLDNNDYEWRSPFDRDITARLFGLTDPVDATQTTDQAYVNAVEPMRRMMEYFVETLETLVALFYTDELSVDFRHYPKFGVYISNKGVERSMFRDNLAGVEASLVRLPHYRDGSCPEACD